MKLDRQMIRTLSEATSESRGTSLVTIYIPSNQNFGIITKSLTNELSTASNIKDKTVRKDVISALKSLSETVKSFNWHNAPENGVVLCSGEFISCL